MSLKSWWEKYEPHVGISSFIIAAIGLALWFITWENRSTKWIFYIVIVAIAFLLFWVIRWCFRFMGVNKYVFLTWRQNRFAKREKLYATKMRKAYSKMRDCQRKIEKKQEEIKTVWRQLLDGNEISKAQKRQEIANRFLESADETHEAAMKRRIRVLIWLINSDQLDINKNPYRAIRDEYIPDQIILRDDSDIYFR
ncbi:MAG: hypothetical protein OXC79_03975 [Candidatus Poribacteria bacterium]|nr:hypothetical protein [Candidatus Poribacteria bacterium]